MRNGIRTLLPFLADTLWRLGRLSTAEREAATVNIETVIDRTIMAGSAILAYLERPEWPPP